MSTAAAAIRRRPFPDWAMGALLASLSVLIGVLSGMGGSAGTAGAVFALAAIALIVVLWRNPALSPIVVMLAALTVEQFPFESGQPGATTFGAPPTPSDYTDRLPLFHGLGGGLHVSPADLLLLALLTMWMLKRGTAETTSVPRSPMTYAVGAVALASIVGVAVGQAHGGQLRTAFTEVRPYVYLGIAYLVATVFTTRLSVLRTAMWALVLGSGFKAAQAFHSFWTVRHQIPRPDFVVGHEEALFFSLFIVLTACLWIFNVPGRLRTTATLLLPLVLVADLVNSRRAAWLILGGELIALTVVTMIAVPARRRFMAKVMAVTLMVAAVYFPAYWNHTGAPRAAIGRDGRRLQRALRRRVDVVRRHHVVRVVDVVVAREVAELMLDHRAELGPVPVDVEVVADRALGVGQRVADVVAHPRRAGVDARAHVRPRDGDLAGAGLDAPVGDGQGVRRGRQRVGRRHRDLGKAGIGLRHGREDRDGDEEGEEEAGNGEGHGRGGDAWCAAPLSSACSGGLRTAPGHMY